MFFLSCISISVLLMKLCLPPCQGTHTYIQSSHLHSSKTPNFSDICNILHLLILFLIAVIINILQRCFSLIFLMLLPPALLLFIICLTIIHAYFHGFQRIFPLSPSSSAILYSRNQDFLWSCSQQYLCHSNISLLWIFSSLTISYPFRSHTSTPAILLSDQYPF